MQIKYRVIGELKRQVGQAEGRLELNKDTTVRELLQALGINDKELIVMLNDRRAEADRALKDGDQVTIIPFAVGG